MSSPRKYKLVIKKRARVCEECGYEKDYETELCRCFFKDTCMTQAEAEDHAREEAREREWQRLQPLRALRQKHDQIKGRIQTALAEKRPLAEIEALVAERRAIEQQRYAAEAAFKAVNVR